MAKRNKLVKRQAVAQLPPKPVLSSRKQTGLIFGALIVLVLAVFGRTVANGFINFDDPDYVTRNTVVQHGLNSEGIRYAFTTIQPYYWQPLSWISHEIDCALFGVRPGAHHLVSVALHGLTAALFFLFL